MGAFPGRKLGTRTFLASSLLARRKSGSSSANGTSHTDAHASGGQRLDTGFMGVLLDRSFLSMVVLAVGGRLAQTGRGDRI